MHAVVARACTVLVGRARIGREGARPGVTGFAAGAIFVAGARVATGIALTGAEATVVQKEITPGLVRRETVRRAGLLLEYHLPVQRGEVEAEEVDGLDVAGDTEGAAAVDG